MQKGAPKFFDPCKGGALNKITTNFPVKIEFTCFSMGLTRNFHGKKGPRICYASSAILPLATGFRKNKRK